ncbi:hypothetical protein K438DRAFT_1985248 [Mycena galopus ATCC 62051]|nr:hypothetical protein K438DRAFT_1985248 [Mycena galopus ATCC 62051]
MWCAPIHNSAPSYIPSPLPILATFFYHTPPAVSTLPPTCIAPSRDDIKFLKNFDIVLAIPSPIRTLLLQLGTICGASFDVSTACSSPSHRRGRPSIRGVPHFQIYSRPAHT